MMKYIYILSFLFFYTYGSFACSCRSWKYIKSIESLEKYEFVALVAVDSVFLSDKPKRYDQEIFHEISFKIIELYKGDSVSAIIVNGGNSALNISYTSCDLGINIDEEWLLTAFKDQFGNLRTSYCQNSELYRNEVGEYNWFGEGISAIKTLRGLYNIKSSTKKTIENGEDKKYYANGQVEVIESYKNGNLEGKHTKYYANGQLLNEVTFNKGKKEGEEKWYFKNAKLRSIEKFHKGILIDTSYYYEKYNDDSYHYKVYGKNGEKIEYAEFYGGKLSIKVTYKGDIMIQYNHHHGLLQKKIIKEKGEKKEVYRFVYEGDKKIVCEHFFYGHKKKKYEIKKWNKKGELIKHELHFKDKTVKEFLNKQ